MIDIHCHITPAMDDGAESLEEALEMLSRAGRNGTEAVILTPHFPNTLFGVDKPASAYRQAMQAFISAPEVVRCGMVLYSGAENYMGQDATDKIRNGWLIPLNDTAYVLVEYPVSVEFSFLRDTVQDMTGRGYRPVLAHAERYDCLQREHDAASRLVGDGCLFQLNRETVCGNNCRPALQLADWLLERDMVCAVASDAHDPYMRHADLSEADQALSLRFSASLAQRLLTENPTRILKNERIY